MSLGTISGLKVLLGVALSDVTQDAALQACLDAAEAAVQNWTKRPGLVSPPVTYDGTGTNPPPVYLDGTGQDSVLLPHRPVTALISAYEDIAGCYGLAPNSFLPQTLLTEGTDFVLVRDNREPNTNYISKAGILKRLRTNSPGQITGGVPYAPYGTLTGGLAQPRWAVALGSIKVSFTAGFVTGGVPADLQMAVNQVAAWVKRNGPLGGQEILTGEGLGQYNYTLAQLAQTAIPAVGGVAQVLAGYKERPF